MWGAAVVGLVIFIFLTSGSPSIMSQPLGCFVAKQLLVQLRLRLKDLWFCRLSYIYTSWVFQVLSASQRYIASFVRAWSSVFVTHSELAKPTVLDFVKNHFTLLWIQHGNIKVKFIVFEFSPALLMINTALVDNMVRICWKLSSFDRFFNII